MEALLIALLVVIAYAFLGYPLLLVVLAAIAPKPVSKRERDDVHITVIIAAYNEEGVIAEKLKNTLDLDYPAEHMEIIVASDGSTDRTDEIVKGFSEKGVILNRVEGRKGKTEAQNQTVKIAEGEIIVFSDANAFYAPDAVRKLVRNFNDPRVGGVCGRLIYVRGYLQGEEEEGLYWKFENLLKETEGLLSSVLGANGSIYAVRKSIYVPLRADLISDLVEPLKIVEKGYRVVYEKEAVSKEDIATVSGAGAFQRKVRINNRTIVGLLQSLNLLNVFKYGFVSFEFFSHKILRYLMPFMLIAVFVQNVFFLNHLPWAVLFSCQCLFYAMAFIGYLLSLSGKRMKIFSLPWYFLWSHLAVLVAWTKFLLGKREITWETNR